MLFLIHFDNFFWFQHSRHYSTVRLRSQSRGKNKIILLYVGILTTSIVSFMPDDSFDKS